MNEYANLQELRAAWISGEFQYPKEFNISGIHYTFRKSSPWEFEKAVRDGRNPYMVYSTAKSNKEAAKEQGLNQWIVLLWGTSDGVSLVPYDLRTISAARGGPMYEQVETIGDVALLKIALPSGVIALKGKVDTGAEISSLHVDGKPKAVGQMVQFMNRNASPNAIQAPLIDQQAVSSADGGTEYRPVIELDVEINGKPVRKVMFNLNDRSSMEYPVLIGQNILEKTNFLVNPKQDGIKEDEEWLTDEEIDNITDQDIETLTENVVPTINLSDNTDPEKIAELYKALDAADISISDLFKHVRTEALQRLKDIEY
jgi:hypothetical protein